MGKAHVLHTEQDFAAGDEHDVLVTRHATPALVPGLIQARAVVCETGGVLNHLAIVARELGKPCVTGLSGIVEAIEPGLELCVDGTQGLVEVRGGGARPRAPESSVERPSSVYMPILQFGLFSAAFERNAASFTIDVAVRTAALVSVPVAFGAGNAWSYVVNDCQVLVPERQFRSIAAVLTDRVESGVLRPKSVRSQYDALCTWCGWDTLRIGVASKDLELAADALERYIILNQLTWAASVIKELLARRYRAFLDDHLHDLQAEVRTRLYLDSLIAPGRSYLLRTQFGSEPRTTWSPVFEQAPGSKATEVARTLADEGGRRHVATLDQLSRWLSGGDLERALSYIAAIGDLLDLTERKNTDLHRCSVSIFGDTARRRSIEELCGVSALVGTHAGSADKRHSAVERIVRWLGANTAHRYMRS